MPQTVPSGVFATDTYAVYEDNFDLSLLPMDGEVPLSPHSQLSIELPPQTNDFTSATSFDDITLIKTEKLSAGNWSIDNTQQQDTIDNLQQYQYYSSPLPSPPQEYFVTVFPPSPTPSIELQPYQQQQNSPQHHFTVIKQEFGLFPPSPPDSHGAPSPRCDVKGEPSDSSDTEACIDIDSLLQNSFDVLVPKRAEQDPQQDHQLLREYLQDTSFQRKHNLKPLALESLFGGWGARGDIEPVISLALEHAKKDVQQTCAALNISPDPQQWTPDQVQSWLHTTITQFELPAVENIEQLFPEDGAALSLLTDDEFIKRIPQTGGTLHAQLEVWKAACSDTPASCFDSQPQSITSNSIPWSPAECMDEGASDAEDDEMSIPQTANTVADTSTTVPMATTSTAPAASTSSNTSTATTTTAATLPPTKTGRQGGSHIHLWQFLKELLATPQQNGTAIRWLDRTKGVFKIEDSVRVARLWGRRKNRPAMNYDKLSRSIRQYYKKGIMKKTERSQRLVYQFCHPYCL